MVNTLKDLSSELGLSQTTVSRALNGFPEVSETTRQRVLAAAERLNYRPSARARSLATGRTMTIGHVLTVSGRHEMMNPVYGDFLAGASEGYQGAGYRIHLEVVPDGDQERAYRDLAAERSVDGFMLQGPVSGDWRIALLQEIGLPFVVHGRASLAGDRGYAWVDVNNREAFREGAERLLRLGHRRIGLVNGLENMDFARRRRDGYRAAIQAKGLQEDPALVAHDEMTDSFGYRAATAMLGGPNPPTAFLAASILIAMGIRRALTDQGLALGSDVSLLTHDDDLSYFRNGEGRPIFTAMRSSVRDAGRIAARLLLDQIARGAPKPVGHLLEADYIEGPTTARAPGTA
ncbi:MAG: substrate-binding domain-containing protein [Pseudomonadota bacterium]